jgi:hypothetical protein
MLSHPFICFDGRKILVCSFIRYVALSWLVTNERIHSKIQKLQPHLPFLLRSWFADPYHLALRTIQWVLVWDDFDNLSTFQS